MLGGYLAQTTPEPTPRLIAPGVVSTPKAAELNGEFSPDGRKFFFTRTELRGGGGEGVFRLLRSVLGNGINTVDTGCCPMVTPDGRYLLFSRRISEPKDSGWVNVVGGNVYWVSTELVEALRE
jgi:hypothetical protein